MSSAKFVIINGSKYLNEEVYLTEQTEEDVEITTHNKVFFTGYVIEKNTEGEVIIRERDDNEEKPAKRRKIN